MLRLRCSYRRPWGVVNSGNINHDVVGNAADSDGYSSVAAGCGSGGTEGLALIYVCAFRVWIDDDTPDMARTMAALDRGLARAEWLMGRLCPGADAESDVR